MKRKKILIFGVSGMAGHIIYKYLNNLNKFEILGTSYRKKIDEKTIILNIINFDKVEEIIQEFKPDYIVNAIGVLIKGSQSSVSNAVLINSYLPNHLSDLSKKYKSKLIHISTDCVFSGNSGDYVEDSFKDGDDTYARSKSLGEIINNQDVTIRTSIIGPELKKDGEGLFHWLMKQSGDINGFKNVFWSGVTTLELAKAIEFIIVKDYFGLCHLTNNQKISKYGLLKIIKEVWNKNELQILEADATSRKDKSFINTKHPEFIISKTYKEMLVDLRNFMLQEDEFFKYKETYQ